MTMQLDDGSNSGDLPVPAEPSEVTWQLRSRSMTFTGRPLFMGILNVTPDSFSDGGQYLEPRAALEAALLLAEQGADILDVGGESTRPGAAPVEERVELARTMPVVAAIVEACDLPVSIDTTKAAVAREALRAGAEIVNDVSGLGFDCKMPEVCAEAKAGVICMHMQGTPATMQEAPRYKDVVLEVAGFLRQRLQALDRQGIPPASVALDPGIGFGKTFEHNVQLLSNIGHFCKLGRPVCIGHSRKRFLKKLLGLELDERLFGTVGVSVAAALQGASILRVHDVQATRDAVLACLALIRKVHDDT
jgi:dihydropteroate synthase